MPTRAQAEAILVGPAPTAGAGRAGGYLKGAGVVVAGTSPVAALSDALSLALAACGVAVADPSSPADADLAVLAPADWYKFLDIAELRLLETAASAAAARPQLQRWEDYQIQRSTTPPLTQALADKRALVARLWGYGATRLAGGTFQVKSVGQCPEF